MPNFAPALIVVVTFDLLALLVTAVGLRRNKKARQSAEATKEKVAQIVREAFGDFPPGEPAPPPNLNSPREQFQYVFLLCVVTPLIYLGLYAAIGLAIRLIVPNMTSAQQIFADNTISLLLPLIIGYLVLPLTRRWWIMRPSQQKFTKREESTLVMLDLIKLLALFSPSIAMLISLDLAYGAFLVFATFVLNFSFLALFLRLFNKSFFTFPQYWVHSAIAKGDYDEALRRAQHLETKYTQTLGPLYYRGTVLLFAGKYSEAENALRQSLQEALNLNILQSEVLTNLGYALMHQGRYWDATHAYEGAIKLSPNSGHAYSGLAQIYLFQGIEPQRALDFVVHFMTFTPKGQVKDKSTWSAIRGDEAWALALLGRDKDARVAIGLAFEMIDRSFRPGVASLRFKEGKVFQIHGVRARAEQSFQYAIQLDPVGMYGQLARQALAELQSDGKITSRDHSALGDQKMV